MIRKQQNYWDRTEKDEKGSVAEMASTINNISLTLKKKIMLL